MLSTATVPPGYTLLRPTTSMTAEAAVIAAPGRNATVTHASRSWSSDQNGVGMYFRGRSGSRYRRVPGASGA